VRNCAQTRGVRYSRSICRSRLAHPSDDWRAVRTNCAWGSCGATTTASWTACSTSGPVARRWGCGRHRPAGVPALPGTATYACPALPLVQRLPLLALGNPASNQQAAHCALAQPPPRAPHRRWSFAHGTSTWQCGCATKASSAQTRARHERGSCKLGSG
jgi:hypothetical protein